MQLPGMLLEINKKSQFDIASAAHMTEASVKYRRVTLSYHGRCQIQISAGDIIQFESGNTSKYYMLSATGTWDEIIKLQ
ncbi:MAG: hypothetical protein WBZ36_26065 [Candidatus Nitrosopolaris sp.]